MCLGIPGRIVEFTDASRHLAKAEVSGVRRTINVGLAIGRDDDAVRRQEDELPSMFGSMTALVKPGILIGTPARVIDRIGEYQRAGAEWVILAMRAPFDWAGLELFIRDVMPAFR